MPKAIVTLTKDARGVVRFYARFTDTTHKDNELLGTFVPTDTPGEYTGRIDPDESIDKLFEPAVKRVQSG